MNHYYGNSNNYQKIKQINRTLQNTTDLPNLENPSQGIWGGGNSAGECKISILEVVVFKGFGVEVRVLIASQRGEERGWRRRRGESEAREGLYGSRTINIYIYIYICISGSLCIGESLCAGRLYIEDYSGGSLYRGLRMSGSLYRDPLYRELSI